MFKNAYRKIIVVISIDADNEKLCGDNCPYYKTSYGAYCEIDRDSDELIIKGKRTKNCLKQKTKTKS